MPAARTALTDTLPKCLANAKTILYKLNSQEIIVMRRLCREFRPAFWPRIHRSSPVIQPKLMECTRELTNKEGSSPI